MPTTSQDSLQDRAHPTSRDWLDPGAARIRFDGQVALVTGAGSGLGRAYAIDLAARGAKVLVNDLGCDRNGNGSSRDPTDAVVAEIAALGGVAAADYDTVATPDAGQRIVDNALSRFGRLDILINNAGIIRDKTLSRLTLEDWQAVLDVHLGGAFHVSKPAFAAMRRQRYGRIICTTSAAALFGNFGQANYAAAKAGLLGFMHALKLEGDRYNVKINAIAPIAGTRLTKDALPPELVDRMKPDFITPLVIFLSSRDCPVSGHIYSAGMGFYNRVAVVASQGVLIGDTERVPAAEEIWRHWAAIDALSEPQEYDYANAAIMGMLTAPSAEED